MDSDIVTLKKTVIELRHVHGVDNHSSFRIERLGSDLLEVYKVKKFACKSLPGRGAKTGLRLIYVYLPAKDEAILLQLYFKADDEDEDQPRIKHMLKALED